MAQTGTIKKFFHDKGFGFITPDDGSEDAFFHVKDNGGDDAFADVNAGDAVSFDTEWNDRKGKYNAINVTGDTISNGGGGGGYGKSGGGKGGDRYSPYGGKGW
mmetsp:Transcript_85985/g.148825  ORF Transcript_85985/g.148825 Transcript_85985/m.148825 type:complete len:103 (+) Transcript_85985:118-426(+)